MPEQPPDPLLPVFPHALIASLAVGPSRLVDGVVTTASVLADAAWVKAQAGAKFDQPTFDLLAAGSIDEDGVLTSGGGRYRLSTRVDDALVRWVQAIALP